MLVRASVGLAVLVVAAAAWADHEAGCVPTGADPATYNVVPVGTWTFYVEERGVPEPLDQLPPIPGSGFLLADGTWVYRETNGVDGLQRGGCGPLVYWSQDPRVGVPVERCQPCIPSEDLCLLSSAEPEQDENCGHGPDTLQ